MMCHLPGKFSPSFTPPPLVGCKYAPMGVKHFRGNLFTGATASKKYIFSQNFIGGLFEDFLSKMQKKRNSGVLGVQKCP